ncbi:polyamine transporter tpo5 [Botrytis cinerea]
MAASNQDAASFAIMAVPFGLSTTLAYSLTDGQSVTVLYGWIFVSCISLAIAASLAEICSVYPTAGGVYYWSAMLSTRKYAPVVSWITGWLTLVGNWTVTLSINFSGAQLILSSISIFNEDFVANAWQTVLCFWAVMAIAFSVNVFGAKYLDLINKICIYWTSASVIIIIVTLLVMANNRRDAEFVFAHFDASASGWPSGWAWFVGLLQAAYTLTGYGMVAAMCEEVQNPEREVPKAMVLSVFAAGVTGILYLVPLLFVLPDVTSVLGQLNGQPIGYIFKTVTGSAAGGFGLLFLILGILSSLAVKHASFSLGRFGFAINAVTVVVMDYSRHHPFCMPTAIPVTPSTMNYASVVFVFFASISLLWYVIRGRKEFSGPPVVSAEEAEHNGEVVGGVGRVVTEDGSGQVSYGSDAEKASRK